MVGEGEILKIVGKKYSQIGLLTPPPSAHTFLSIFRNNVTLNVYFYYHPVVYPSTKQPPLIGK